MKFYVDFSGYCEVEAKDEIEARANFWKRVEEDKPLPSNIYEIIGIEEKEDD
jgi:hypothetical protein